MTDNKLVYIASPYAGNVEENVIFARHACRCCVAKGHTPIAPHLLYTQMLDDSDPVQREIGLSLGRKLMEHVDELWVCGEHVSPGMAAEISTAESLDIPIRRIRTIDIAWGSAELKVRGIKTADSPSEGMEMVMR